MLELLLKQSPPEEVKQRIQEAITKAQDRRRGLLTGAEAWKNSPHYDKAPINI